MLQAKQFTFGKLGGTIYDAEDIDDTLPMHSHEEDTIHITIVARGSFVIRSGDWEIISKAGDVIDWQVGQSHELIALEPNSRFVNIRKGGT